MTTSSLANLNLEELAQMPPVTYRAIHLAKYEDIGENPSPLAKTTPWHFVTMPGPTLDDVIHEVLVPNGPEYFKSHRQAKDYAIANGFVWIRDFDGCVTPEDAVKRKEHNESLRNKKRELGLI